MSVIFTATIILKILALETFSKATMYLSVIAPGGANTSVKGNIGFHSLIRFIHVLVECLLQVSGTKAIAVGKISCTFTV